MKGELHSSKAMPHRHGKPGHPGKASDSKQDSGSPKQLPPGQQMKTLLVNPSTKNVAQKIEHTIQDVFLDPSWAYVKFVAFQCISCHGISTVDYCRQVILGNCLRPDMETSKSCTNQAGSLPFTFNNFLQPLS